MVVDKEWSRCVGCGEWLKDGCVDCLGHECHAGQRPHPRPVETTRRVRAWDGRRG